MIVYLRSHGRRPIRLGPGWGSSDAQGEIPRFWCCCCGAEVFCSDTIYCSRCHKEDIENEEGIC